MSGPPRFDMVGKECGGERVAPEPGVPLERPAPVEHETSVRLLPSCRAERDLGRPRRPTYPGGAARAGEACERGCHPGSGGEVDVELLPQCRPARGRCGTGRTQQAHQRAGTVARPRRPAGQARASGDAGPVRSPAGDAARSLPAPRPFPADRARAGPGTSPACRRRTCRSCRARCPESAAIDVMVVAAKPSDRNQGKRDVQDPFPGLPRPVRGVVTSRIPESRAAIALDTTPSFRSMVLYRFQSRVGINANNDQGRMPWPGRHTRPIRRRRPPHPGDQRPRPRGHRRMLRGGLPQRDPGPSVAPASSGREQVRRNWTQILAMRCPT